MSSPNDQSTEQSDLIADTTRRIFRDLGDPQAMCDDSQRQTLWRALDDAGLTRTWVPDQLGGAGASIADGFNVLRIAGEFAVNVPLAEQLLSGWLLSRANRVLPAECCTLAPVDERDRFTLDTTNSIAGMARRVPFARDAKHIVVMANRDENNFIALVERTAAKIAEQSNIAGDARDHVHIKNASVQLAPTDLTFADVLLFGATARSMQMAGALQGLLALTVAYANDRIAFEKPIGKFQAIQHSLARLAGETAAAVAAATSAADALSTNITTNEAAILEVASAKIRVGEAVSVATAIAHQVHGAIGFTQEHVLHRYTQRLWAWRDDFGDESAWALRLGRLVARNGADALWPMLAAR